jgi:hypothetical protein
MSKLRANPSEEVFKRQLSNRLDGIVSARRKAAEALSEISRLLSHLPNTVPDLAPDEALEWHERLRMLEHLIDTGKASWNSADHHLSSIISRISKDVLGE